MLSRPASVWLTPVLLAATAPTAMADNPWKGKVVRISSGDTITVQDIKVLVRVTLHGIDCPELGQPRGEEARRFTAERVSGKVVTIKSMSEYKPGPVVARVYYRGMKRCLNDELVEAGLAWWRRKHAPKQGQLAKLEAEAKKAGRGLWAEKDPVAPWLWRAEHPPRLPWSKGRVCKQDSDCALLPRICPGCPSCEPTWRTPGNRDALKQIREIQPKVKCRRPRGCKCARGRRLGTKAVCRGDQCAVAISYRGDVKSKVLHWTGCRHYRCKGCTAVFKSVEAALKAGYHPHEACAEAPPPPSLPEGAHPKLSPRYRRAPARPWSKDRLCKSDSDCTLGPLNEPCTCRPCAPAWRRAINKAADRAWKAKWAARSCRRRRVCPACTPLVLGRKAVCVEGQCSVRP